MSDALTSNGGVNSGIPNQELNQPAQQQSQLQQLQLPHQPSMFRRVFGGIAGLAGNALAPGIGGALGNIIGGNSGFAGELAASGLAANAANFAAANALQEVATQANQEQEMVQLASTIAKSKHQTFMSIIQNIS
jgi:hypothetical protein